MAKEVKTPVVAGEEDKTATPYVKDTKIEMTEKNPYHKTGTKQVVAKHMADHLVKKGYATLAAIAMLFMFAFAGPDASAQVQTATMRNSLTTSVDSIRCISTVANYLYVSPSRDYHTGVFQPTVTRRSTAIGGSIFLQGSVDGSNWYTTTYAAGDTVTVADAASQVLKIVLTPTNGLPYKYYRLKCTGASSDTMTVRAIFCGRP
jgi:hypothetical protein